MGCIWLLKITCQVYTNRYYSNWYRTYSDGWLEQGNSVYIGSAGQYVTFFRPYTTAYTVVSGGNTYNFGNTVCYSGSFTGFHTYTGDDDSFNAGYLAYLITGY